MTQFSLSSTNTHLGNSHEKASRILDSRKVKRHLGLSSKFFYGNSAANSTSQRHTSYLVFSHAVDDGSMPLKNGVQSTTISRQHDSNANSPARQGSRAYKSALLHARRRDTSRRQLCPIANDLNVTMKSFHPSAVSQSMPAVARRKLHQFRMSLSSPPRKQCRVALPQDCRAKRTLFCMQPDNGPVKSVHPSLVNEADKENWNQVVEAAGRQNILQTLQSSDNGGVELEGQVTASVWPGEQQIPSLSAVITVGTEPVPEVLPQDMGFPNPPGSNRCWMNATLQMLLGMEPFMEELECFCLRRDQSTLCAVLRSFSEVMKYRRWRRRLSLHSALKQLFQSLGMLDAMFLSDRQQDATEFLLRLLDLFRDQFGSSSPDLGLQDVKVKESYTLRELQLENLASGGSAVQRCPSGGRLAIDGVRSPVRDNVEFCLKELYCCTHCSESTSRCQDHLALFLDIPPTSHAHPSLQEALNHYMQSDIRELKCGKCGGQHSKVETAFTKLPRFLLVQVKRYAVQTTVTEKLRSLLRVPVTLSVKNCVADADVMMPVPWLPHSSKDQDSLWPLVDKDAYKELQEVMCQGVEEDMEVQDLEKAIKLSLEEQQMTQMNYSPQQDDADVPVRELEEQDDSPEHGYRLVCVLMHRGLSLNCGHYVADVYDIRQQQWYHYDDEVVSRITEDEVLGRARQRNGYIFCYMHRDLFNQLVHQNRHVDKNPAV